MDNLQDIRQDYLGNILDRSHLTEEPIALFRRWMEDAVKNGVDEPTAFTLSSVNAQGRPHSRIVLLKGIENEGFQFFTNYDSAKARDMAQQPWVCLNFFWKPLFRQVRISGQARKIDRVTSESYFASRPRGSQLGAWASHQSQIIRDRKELEENLKAVQQRFEDFEAIPCPPHWGGYVVEATSVEFWQGRQNRLHDRFVYEKTNSGWHIDRLSP